MPFESVSELHEAKKVQPPGHKINQIFYIVCSAWSMQTRAKIQLSVLLKWNSRQKATEALFVIEYESNLCVKA